MKELVFLLRVLRKEVLKWTTMHEFKQKATNFHIEWTLDDTIKIIAQNYSVELDIGQSEVLKMLLSHILEEKVIHATSSEITVKERQPEEEGEPKITVEDFTFLNIIKIRILRFSQMKVSLLRERLDRIFNMFMPEFNL
jgi:antitoxin component of RelBE/YafQ-DinJ toxin-antitoxin module